MGPDHSPDLQAERGKLSGASRRAKVAARDRNIVLLAGEGHTSGEISRADGRAPGELSSYVLKRDAPLLAATAAADRTARPWVDLACSEQ